MDNQATLAERCYNSVDVDMELFDKVNEILGCNTNNCIRPGFVFAVMDTYWDEYDGSIEVILNDSTPEITDEQAIQILSLGFGQIYVSHKGIMTNIFNKVLYSGVSDKTSVTRDVYTDPRYSRKGDEDNQLMARLRAARAEIMSLRKVAQQALDYLTPSLPHLPLYEPAISLKAALETPPPLVGPSILEEQYKKEAAKYKEVLEWIKAGDVLNEHPLTLNNSEDARYVWPERMLKIVKMATAALEDE